MSNMSRKIKKNIAQVDFVRFPDELLWERSLVVDTFDESIYPLIRKMRLANSREKGLGVAAPQVGSLKRMFYYRVPEIGEGVIINPKIVDQSDELVTIKEGCLSIRGYYFDIARPAEIAATWQDQHGQEYYSRLDGLMARLFQHEVDHLDGKLIVDLINEEEYDKFEHEYFDLDKKYSIGAMFVV